jgi:protein TonB
MVLVQHQPRHVRPSPARVTAWSGAFALHVVVFAVLIAPIARPLLVDERDPPKDEPMFVTIEPRAIPVPKIEPVPTPVERPKPRVRERPVVPAVEIVRPEFSEVVLADPVEDAVVETHVDTDVTMGIAGPMSASLGVLEGPRPGYPIIALRRGWEGVVVLRVEVDAGGKPVVVEIEKSSGHRVLDDAARRQVLGHWQFVPALRDGVAVPAVGLVPFDFTIPRG